MPALIERRERALLLSILGLSLLVQLFLAPFRGFFTDLQQYTEWGQYFMAHPSTFYVDTAANYPPLMVYVFAAIDQSYQWIAGLLHLQYVVMWPSLTAIPVYDVMWFWAKLFIIGANVGAAWLIYRLARKHGSVYVALIAATAYAFAPTLLFVGALWGQTDGVPVFYLLLALYALEERRLVVAGVLLGIMVMLKMQPLIFLPVLACYVYTRFDWRALIRASAACTGTVVVICLPVVSQLHELPINGEATMVCAAQGAFNLWYLLMPPWSLASTHVIGPFSATTVGEALFVPFVLVACLLVLRNRSTLALYLALSLIAVAFFTVGPSQHERYMIQGLPPLLLSAVSYRRSISLFVVASVTTLYNAAIQALSFAASQHLPIPLATWVANAPYGVNLIAAGLSVVMLVALTGLCIWLMGFAKAPRHLWMRQLGTQGGS